MRVHVRVPATSANLGPGFDALGLALTLHNEIVLSEAEGVRVAIEGEGAARLPRTADNVVARGVKLAYEVAGRPFRGCALECTNRVPAARGLGSSAAAWVGGLTVSCVSGSTVTAVSLPVPASLRWVALIPEVTSATTEARAVLPASVPHHDAVFNVQRVALLLASLWAGRLSALGAALEDRLHQPYRLKLFPWMPDVVRAARAAGALGCVLSGAGPSLLAVVAGDEAPVAGSMEAALRRAGIAGAARVFGVDASGAVSRVV